MSDAARIDWVTRPRGSLFSLDSGAAPPSFRPGDLSGPALVYGANGPIGSSTSGNFEPGYLVGRVGAAGSVTRVDAHIWASDNTLTAFPRPNQCDFRFAEHLLQFLNLARLSTTTAQPLITQGNLARVKALVPGDLHEQARIAAVLDTVDEAIAKTEAVIAKLKQIRAGLLHDLLTRGLDDNGELRAPPKEVPHLYRDSSLGRVPKEWEVCLLDDVAARGSDHTPSREVPSYWNGGVKWVSLADSGRLDQIYIYETAKEISERGIENSSAVKHPPGTVVLLRDAGVGKSGILAEEMAVSQHFIAWRCGERLHQLFLCFWLQRTKPRFESVAMGTTIKTIGLPYFKRLQIAVPPRHEQSLVADAVLTLETTVSADEEELAKLVLLKSGLMKDLLSGDVRVPAPPPSLAAFT